MEPIALKKVEEQYDWHVSVFWNDDLMTGPTPSTTYELLGGPEPGKRHREYELETPYRVRSVDCPQFRIFNGEPTLYITGRDNVRYLTIPEEHLGTVQQIIDYWNTIYAIKPLLTI